MRVAVIADVHANAPALEAVLEAIAGSGAERLVCLGDMVGYNAEPHACIARLRDVVDTTVAGNHDVDVVRAGALAGTSAHARRVQDWTREQLDADDLAWLAERPVIAFEPGLVAVHGCYLNPSHYSGYVTSTMLETNLRAVAQNAAWPQVALCGHTHVPMCGWLTADGYAEPRFDGTLRWPASARAVLINPGSVGQPRDGDARASFALVDPEDHSVELRRVEYDVERSVRALRAAGLPDALGERLREGR